MTDNFTENLEISILKSAEVSPDLKAKKAKLDARCFHVTDPADHKNNYFRQPKYDLFMTDNYKLVAAIEIYEIKTKWHDQQIVVGGIGSVMTDQSHRGRGLAKSLLAEALEIMRRDKYDFALLQTNVKKGISLYGSIGFIPMNRECKYHKKDGKIGLIKANDTMILPLANPKLVDEIINSNNILHIGGGAF